MLTIGIQSPDFPSRLDQIIVGVGQRTVYFVFSVWLLFSCDHKFILLLDRDLLDSHLYQNDDLSEDRERLL